MVWTLTLYTIYGLWGCFSFKFRQSVNRILHVCSIKRAFVFVGTWSAFLWQRQMVWNTLCMWKTGRQIYLHITVFHIHKHRRCWRCLMQTYVPLRKTTERERLLYGTYIQNSFSKEWWSQFSEIQRNSHRKHDKSVDFCGVLFFEGFHNPYRIWISRQRNLFINP